LTFAIVATPIVIPAIVRVIEQILRDRTQSGQLRIILEGFKQSDEAGRSLTEAVKHFTDVDIQHAPPSIPSGDTKSDS